VAGVVVLSSIRGTVLVDVVRFIIGRVLPKLNRSAAVLDTDTRRPIDDVLRGVSYSAMRSARNDTYSTAMMHVATL